VADADAYRELGEAAWRWVLANVHDDEGPWLPTTVDGTDPLPTAAADRSTLYFGTGGLALVLAELASARALDDRETALADAVRASVAASSVTGRYASLYFGLAGDATTLRVLGDESGAARVLRRTLALRETTGWALSFEEGAPAVVPNDVIAGSAGVAMAGVWCGGEDGRALARLAASLLMDAAEAVPTGLEWPMFPGHAQRLPNFSHGTAGVAAALAVAGHALGDDALLDAARRGAEHLVAIGDLADDGFTLPHYVPHAAPDEDVVTFSWCHGPTGTSLLFAALADAGVDSVRDLGTAELRARCLRSVLASGVPDRVRPGFWDNDGQCCGTAGVGDTLLSAAQDSESPSLAERYRDAAVRMGDALAERAVRDDAGARWQFLEHRSATPLLPPGTGWSHGAAGIAAFLLRLARVLEQGVDAPAVDRPDTWWSVPDRVRTFHRVGE
jgi:lantibiotic modifying enzyme